MSLLTFGVFKKYAESTKEYILGRIAKIESEIVTQREFDVEKSRITNLARLSEGSTTGDAELKDIRVGQDGIIYASAGEAVRNQVGNINDNIEAISDYQEVTDLVSRIGYVRGVIGGEAEVYVSYAENSYYMIECRKGDRFRISGAVTSEDMHLLKFVNYETGLIEHIAGAGVGGQKVKHIIEYVIPSDGYIYINWWNSNPVSVEKFGIVKSSVISKSIIYGYKTTNEIKTLEGMFSSTYQTSNTGVRLVLGVVEGETYQVSGLNRSSYYPLYVLLKGRVIDSYYEDGDDNTLYNDVEVTIPSGVTEMVINGMSETQISVKIKKQVNSQEYIDNMRSTIESTKHRLEETIELNDSRYDETLQNINKKLDSLTNTVSGESITVSDSFNNPVRSLKIFGKTEIVSEGESKSIKNAGEDGSITVSIMDQDRSNIQSIDVSTPNGLLAIQITEELLSNYTDDSGNMMCCDIIDFENKVYIKRIYREVLDGSKQYRMSDESVDGAVFYYESTKAPISDYHQYFVCDSRTIVSIDNNSELGLDELNIHKINDNTTLQVAFRSEQSIDLEEFISERNSNPIVLQYILAEPVITPISDELIQSYKSVHMNSPVTIVENTDNTPMELTYNVNIKTYIDNLENKRNTEIEQLKSAIIALGGSI